MNVIKKEKAKFRIRVIDQETGKSVSVLIANHKKMQKEELMDIVVKKLEEHKI